MVIKHYLRFAALGCVCWAGSVAAADQASFDQIMADAEAARAMAAEAEYEWRDTAKLMDQAKALAEGGDFEEAEKLALKAKQQGDAAIAQAKQQEERWQSFVVQ